MKRGHRKRSKRPRSRSRGGGEGISIVIEETSFDSVTIKDQDGNVLSILERIDPNALREADGSTSMPQECGEEIDGPFEGFCLGP